MKRCRFRPKWFARIHTELKGSQGHVYSQADFEYVLLPEASFKRVAGIDELLPPSF